MFLVQKRGTTSHVITDIVGHIKKANLKVINLNIVSEGLLSTVLGSWLRAAGQQLNDGSYVWRSQSRSRIK